MQSGAAGNRGTGRGGTQCTLRLSELSSGDAQLGGKRRGLRRLRGAGVERGVLEIRRQDLRNSSRHYGRKRRRKVDCTGGWRGRERDGHCSVCRALPRPKPTSMPPRSGQGGQRNGTPTLFINGRAIGNVDPRMAETIRVWWILPRRKEVADSDLDLSPTGDLCRADVIAERNV